MLGRLQGAWRELDRDQRLAAFAALGLLVTLFLPWYQATVVERGQATTPTFNAFGVFSFVEAAILLVALGVFVLLFARGERRGFHLPGGDGTVIFAAGLWSALLLLWRVFDRPDIERAVSDGITWGFFFAFLAAAALAAIGWRLRAAGRPEPPIVRHDDGDADYGPRTAATEVTPRRRRRPAPAPEGATEQLTLEDAAPELAAPPPRAAPPREPEPPEPHGSESLWSGPSRDDAPAPRDPAPEPPPAPEVFRGVFDQAADEPTRRIPRERDPADEPLRPGEIPPAPDR